MQRRTMLPRQRRQTRPAAAVAAAAAAAAATAACLLGIAGGSQLDIGRFEHLSWTGRCFPDGERELVQLEAGGMVRITSNKGSEVQPEYAADVTCEWLVDGESSPKPKPLFLR